MNFIASIVCVIAAGIMAVKGQEDWGWFLFVAILIAVS